MPFMSLVIDTLAFKYLLETQDLPPLRPFHAMLDKAQAEPPRCVTEFSGPWDCWEQ